MSFRNGIQFQGCKDLTFRTSCSLGTRISRPLALASSPYFVISKRALPTAVRKKTSSAPVGSLPRAPRGRPRSLADSPLGYGEFKSADEIAVLENPVIAKIGQKHGKSTAATVLRWHIQRGVCVPPFSLYENELRENLKVGDWALDEEDMVEIATLDKAYHYLRPEAWYGLPLWS